MEWYGNALLDLLDERSGVNQVPLTVGLSGESLVVSDDETEHTHPRTDMIVAPSTIDRAPPLRAGPLCQRQGIIALAFAMTLTLSCSGGGTDVPEDTAGREAFIGAYVDLRSAAATTVSTDLREEVRDSILEAYDVTGQDLLDFVDSHGEDVAFMRDLWTELEALLSERLEQEGGDEGNEG